LKNELTCYLGKTSKSSSLSWKLILSCPDLASDEHQPASEFLPFVQMLRRKFQKSLGGSSISDDTNKSLLVCRTVPGQERPGRTVSVCVRQVTPADLEAATFSELERKRLFSGASGLLALVGLEGENWEADLQRLDSGMRILIYKFGCGFYYMDLDRGSISL
jgi:hypothetical protein